MLMNFGREELGLSTWASSTVETDSDKDESSNCLVSIEACRFS